MAEYKIKDLETLTGIKAHTLRIWEKRYGILTPERTATQIRTYNDNELKSLLNISLLYKNGYKISHIAAMSNPILLQTVQELTIDKEDDSVIDQMVLALLDMREDLFVKTFDNLIRSKDIQTIYKEYIVPFLYKIGHLWMVGTINPAQEHFISSLLRQKIIAEIDKLPIANSDAPKVILYLPEHEWHEITLLIYNHYLRSQGYQTFYLGQALPFSCLEETIKKIQPDAILCSWITAVDEDHLLQYASLLKNIYSGKFFLSGSQIVPLRSKLPANFTVIQSLSDLNSIK